MFEIVFTLAAEVEWFDLVRQYGERFEKPFERTLTLLRSNPQMGIEIRVPPLRRVLVSRSQWGIYYGVVGQR
ncbi:MAG: hypothetical protein KDN19_23815, partial [Verrucomicrobiae bacterium]|nr:hypothetical protein [Verrucomicrobiae bacterium]